MIEKELKYLFSKEDFEKLRYYCRERCAEKKTAALKNYYFDTPRFHLLHAGIALRLRSSNKRWTLAFKCRIKGKLFNQRRPGVLVSEELEASLEESDARALLSGERKLFSLDISFLRRLETELEVLHGRKDEVACRGSMAVIREKVLFAPYTLPLEFDTITYEKGEQEFELESETDQLEMAESVLSALFRRLDIKAVPSPYPKIVRLFLLREKNDSILSKWRE
jgi:uncharacterized protein YjbK